MFSPQVGTENRPFLNGANIVWDGNSISTEDYSIGAGIPRQLQQILAGYGINTIVNGYNGLTGLVPIPVSGQTTRNMIGDTTSGTPTGPGGDACTEVDSRLSPSRFNICVAFELTNDLLYYGIAEPNRVDLARDNIRNYCKLRKSAGWYVIVMGGTPRTIAAVTGMTQAVHEADRLALDRRIEATYQEFADLWFDTAKLVPEYNISTLSLYCPGDGVHPLAYGCGIVASRMADFMMQNFRLD